VRRWVHHAGQDIFLPVDCRQPLGTPRSRRERRGLHLATHRAVRLFGCVKLRAGVTLVRAGLDEVKGRGRCDNGPSATAARLRRSDTSFSR
jgi:hypothetical protein